jgi:hypothetical protein
MKRRERRKDGTTRNRRKRNKDEKGFLFLCGVARSGTTAAAELLNLHPQIAMGIERYKALYGRPGEVISAELFNRARFFDYRPTDTNIRLARGGFARLYREMDGKFDQARYVGDKLPRLYQLYDRVAEALPAAKFIYLVRDPLRTASSWQVRADNARDSWKPENDFRRSIAEWNRANQLTLQFIAKDPARVLVVRYEDFFGGDNTALNATLKWLDLRRAESLDEAYRTQFAPEAVSISQKTSVLSPAQQHEIAGQVDWDTFNQLVSAHTPQPSQRRDQRRRRKQKKAAETNAEAAG